MMDIVRTTIPRAVGENNIIHANESNWMVEISKMVFVPIMMVDL